MKEICSILYTLPIDYLVSLGAITPEYSSITNTYYVYHCLSLFITIVIIIIITSIVIIIYLQWYHMETSSASFALYEENHLSDGYPHKRSVMWSFGVFLLFSLNKLPVEQVMELSVIWEAMKFIWDTTIMYCSHWGRMTHICMRHWPGSSLAKLMACRLLGTRPLPEPILIHCQLDSGLWINFSKIIIEIRTFSLKIMHLKMSSAKCRPSYLALNVLKLCFLRPPIN